MALEKRFPAVTPQLLTSDGGTKGVVTVADTCLFKVKQEVILSGSGLENLELEVKRVDSSTQMRLGPRSSNIKDYANLTSYTTAAGSFVFTNEQNRPNIPFEEYQRAMYEEEPVVAIRSIMVDKYGNLNDADNPLYVQLSDGSVEIGTVNAEIEVQLSHIDNFPDTGDVADSVRVGDGVEIMQINPDGSINANIIPSSSAVKIVNTYNSITSVATDTPTTVTSYTAPAGKLAIHLIQVDTSGTNTAEYTVKINGAAVSKKRSYFGGALNTEFKYGDSLYGILLSAGDVVTVEAEHSRGAVGDFESNIQVVEIT